MKLQKLVHRLPAPLQRHKLLRMLLMIAPFVKRQQVVFNGGSTLVADISDSAVRNYFLRAEFEPEFFAISLPFLKDGGVFFDVGANFGFCTFGLLGAHPGSSLQYHLFEANDEICEYLRESESLHPECNVRIVHAVVSDQPGETRFSINSDALGESTVSEHGTLTIPNIVLDDYIEEHGITRVDFAKMDIEGWEPMALKGCVRSLRKGIFKAIYVEVVPELLNRNGFSVEDVLNLPRENGYEFFFCKQNDHNEAMIPAASWQERTVCGHRMLLAPVTSFQLSRGTDLLAVHRPQLT